MVTVSTNRIVERAELEEFVATRHRGVFNSTRADGRPQASLVTMGLHEGDILVATYPTRAKVANVRKNPAASMVVMSDEFNGEWVQLYGTASVVDLPDAVDALVDYFRSIRGDHDNWDEYREAMEFQQKCAIRMTIDEWGPIARGGFPADVAARMEARS